MIPIDYTEPVKLIAEGHALELRLPPDRRLRECRISSSGILSCFPPDRRLKVLEGQRLAGYWQQSQL